MRARHQLRLTVVPPGKEEYAFVYRMEVVRSGSNIIRVRKLTFGGTDYPIKPFLLKIDGETYL